MKSLKISILSVFIIFLLAACSRTPKGVIKQNKMANLLADIHTAEAVVDANYTQFGTDSAKQALKQAVFEKHHVTQDEFDNSLDWYAHNIDKYIAVYDKTIKILEERSQKAGSLAVREAISLAGDSVDVWTGAPYLTLSSRMPSRFVSFDLADDENFEPGDVYVMRAKLLGNTDLPTTWTFTANYADGYIDNLQASSNSGRNEWVEMTFATDSTRTLQRLRGGFEPSFTEKDLWIDSIMLVRKRVDHSNPVTRYRVRQYKTYSPPLPGSSQEEDKEKSASEE